MLSNQQMVTVLRYLKAANLSGPIEEGQAAVWVDALAAKMPNLRIEDAQAACREMVTSRSAAKGNTWITPGDLIDEVKRIRSKRLDSAGTLPEAPTYLGVDGEREWTRRIRALVGDGLTADDAAKRARSAMKIPEPEHVETVPIAGLLNKTLKPRPSGGVSA
ncbi:hypothetical protein SAMN06309944_0230 [Micrococcales bacterium KH10]|nr:hypothetical protein SAMN06309944_0230 [Micrococcales bacterium KH10]